MDGRKNALRELEAALQLALSQGQTLEAARILTRIGGLQFLLNDPAAAVATHTQALTLLSNTPNPEIEIDNLNGTAAAYLNLPQKDDLAQAAAERARTLSKQVGYTRGEAESLLLLSDLQNRADHAAAVVTSKTSLALWKSVDDKEGVARAYIRIGTFYLAQSLVEDATQSFLQARDVWRSLGNVSQEAEALIMLGYTEYRKGDWQASIDYYTQAYGMFDEDAEAQRWASLVQV